MTLNELREHVVSITWKGWGHYRVTITWRGKEYSTTSNNSLAWDRIKSQDYYLDTDKGSEGCTLKQAYYAFYEEVKRNNHLGEYNY